MLGDARGCRGCYEVMEDAGDAAGCWGCYRILGMLGGVG